MAGYCTTRCCWDDQPHQLQECLICQLLPLQVAKRLNVRRERRHVQDVQRAAAAEALRREEEQFDHIKHEFELDNAGIRSGLVFSSCQTKSASGCCMQEVAKHLDSWWSLQAAHQPLVLIMWDCKVAKVALLSNHSSPNLGSTKEASHSHAASLTCIAGTCCGSGSSTARRFSSGGSTRLPAPACRMQGCRWALLLELSSARQSTAVRWAAGSCCPLLTCVQAANLGGLAAVYCC